MTKVRLDKLNASKHGNLESVKLTQELGNGAPIAIGELLDGEREVVALEAPSATAEVLLLAHPEVNNALVRGFDSLDWTNKDGAVARAYHLTEGDIFTVEASLFDAVPAKGDIVEAQADYTYAVNATPSAKTQFKVEALEKIGHDGRDAVVLKVVQA